MKRHPLVVFRQEMDEGLVPDEQIERGERLGVRPARPYTQQEHDRKERADEMNQPARFGPNRRKAGLKTYRFQFQKV